jgi:hypothetical protein
MYTAPPDPGEELRGVELLEGIHGTWDCNPGGSQTPIDIGMCMGRIWREGVTGPTASKIRESLASMKTCGGLGGVSIAPAGFTKVTSTANTTSVAVDDYEHIRRPCFHIRLARFFVDSSLSRHNSSTIPSRGLHDCFSIHHSVLDLHIFEHHHLGHELFNYATLTSPTTLEVEDTLARTPYPRVVAYTRRLRPSVTPICCAGSTCSCSSSPRR